MIRDDEYIYRVIVGIDDEDLWLVSDRHRTEDQLRQWTDKRCYRLAQLHTLISEEFYRRWGEVGEAKKGEKLPMSLTIPCGDDSRCPTCHGGTEGSVIEIFKRAGIDHKVYSKMILERQALLVGKMDGMRPLPLHGTVRVGSPKILGKVAGFYRSRVVGHPFPSKGYRKQPVTFKSVVTRYLSPVPMWIRAKWGWPRFWSCLKFGW